MRILLTGATGFVGSHLYPALIEAGHEVLCATRSPEVARAREPERRWVQCDVANPASVAAALDGCHGAYYLVHSLSSKGNYPEREARAAEVFRLAAAGAGLEKIVYLGGVAPRGRPSAHLRSRIRCGEILREGPVPAFELRAAMIIGAGSVSWQMVHDLAKRLPAMVLPRWMANHSWPIAIRDVVHALASAMTAPVERAGRYDVPGPERMSHRELLERVARVLGRHPRVVSVPFVTPHLSSYWIGLVSDVDFHVATELVEGLRSDLDPTPPLVGSLLPHDDLLGLEESVQLAIEEETGRPGDLSRGRKVPKPIAAASSHHGS